MLKSWWNRTFARTFGRSKRISDKRSLRFEPLEERNLLTITVTQVLPDWIKEGPTNPPAFNAFLGGNGFFTTSGSIAYDDVSNIIMGAPVSGGDIEQTATGSLNWRNIAGSTPGVVQVDDISNPALSTRYSSNQFLGTFVSGTTGQSTLIARDFNPAGQQVGPTRTLPLIVNGANGADIQSVEFCRFLGPGSIQPFNPWVLNNVDPTRLMIGTDFLWESNDSGNSVTCLEGLIDDNSNIVDDNLDGNPDDGTEFEPDWGGNPNGDPPTNVQQLSGSVTVLDYGGRNPNGTLNPDVLWVGTIGATPLLLRTSGNGTLALPNPVTAYTGGAPVAIAMNPNNWTQTYVIDNNTVYQTLDGGQTFTAVNGNLPIGGLASMTYISGGPRGDSIAVGGFGGGIYRMFVNNPGVWTAMDDPFPNNTLPIFTVTDMVYDSRDNVLIAGTLGGGAFELTNANDDRPTNVITVDGAGAADQVNFVLAANGNLSVTDTTGPGPHALAPTLPLGTISRVVVQNMGGLAVVNLDFTNGNPIPNAPFSIDGSGAIDTVTANAVSNYVLTNTSLRFTGFNRTISLTNVSNAQLTGVGSNFDISGWTGGGSLIGTGVNNTVTSTADTNFTLSGGPGVPGGLITTALGTAMTLNNIASALLTGGPGANNFNVTGWFGTGIISGGGGAGDSLTQMGNSSYTFNTTQLNSTNGVGVTALNLVGILTQNYTAGPLGATFLDNGLANGAVAFLTATAGQPNTVTSQKDVDFTLTNTQIIGGTGIDNLTNPGAFTAINITGGANAHNIDVSAYTGAITPTLTAAADTLKAAVAATTVAYTLNSNALNITTTGPARNVNFSIAAMGNINLTGGTGTNTFNVNSWNHPGSFFGTSGNSTYNIGGAVGAGNLNGVTGKITLNSTAGTNQLNVNDAANLQGTNYHIDDKLIAIDTTTNPARPSVFGASGLTYNAAINNVTVYGSKGSDKYLVTPSVTTKFTADNSAALAVNGFLGTVFLGTTNHVRTFTNGPTNTNGFWTLTTAANPQPQKINWVNISANNMNGLGLLVLGGGTQPSNTSQPIVQVYDAETGLLKSQFLAYPSTFQLGIKVAVGGDLGGALGPVIVTAPGRGIVGTVNFYSKTTAPAGTVNATTPQGTLPAATLGSFQPYGASYTNGINIALGRVNPATGLPDLIVAPQRGALPVKVYSLAKVGANVVPTLKGSFMAYPASYIGGVNVAGGDILGHNVTDVVTAPQSGMQATVEVWNGATITGTTATLFRSFLAMTASFHGGVSLAVGDVNGDGKLDIVTGAGSTGGSIISVFSGAAVVNTAVPLGIIGSNPTVNGTLVTPFAAYTDPSNFAPVSVALKDVDGDGRMEIVTVQGTNGKSNLLRYWKVNPGGNPPVFQYPNTAVGAPPTPLGGLSIG